MLNGIFISYRRDDAPGYAGRLYDRLAAHFGADRVFMDVQGIEPGVDFVEVIERALGSCEILIVLIGKDWLATDSAGRRRLDDPGDFVRLETATALARGIRVVPVLVEGAEMPRAEGLPADLLPLVRRQAVELSHNQWEATSSELIRTLEKILDRGQPRATGGVPLERARAETQAATSTPQAESPPTVAGGLRAKLYWGLGGLSLLIAATALYLAHPWRAGVGPAPSPAILSVTPDKLEFDSQPLRVAAPTSAITITNRGGATLHIGTVKLEGPAAADFALSENRCGRGELPPGASCELRVTFSPQATGARAASLVIAHDAASTPASVDMQGRGVEPVVAQSTPRVEKSGPPPAAQAAPPAEHGPAVAAAPPKILRFDSKLIDDRVQLCYGVENAASAAITPEPGAVKPLAKECMFVAGGGRKTYILSARNAAGDVVTRAISVDGSVKTQPPQSAKGSEQLKPGDRVAPDAIPAPPVVAAAPPGFPRVGDRWEYNFRSMWKNVEPRTFTHQVSAVSDREVRETMSFVANGGKVSDSKSFAAESRFVEWRGQGYYFVEFNPFLQAFGTVQPGTTWKSLVTPIEDPFLSNWYSQGRVIGWETVSVPAGSFKALRVELTSNRNASASSSAQGAPANIRYVIWYGPEAKRTVKHVRTVLTTDGTKLAEDTYELVKYVVQ